MIVISILTGKGRDGNVRIKDRISYNSAEVVQKVEAALDRLKPFQYDSRYKELLGMQLVEKLTYWDQNIRRRKDDPFTLVVCGEFKRGKSSLVNALLMEEVVPVNITTETVTLNRISYGVHKNEAVLSGGRRLTLTDEELCRSSLEKIMEEVGEPIEKLELWRPIDVLKDITVIDTPGLEDSVKDFSSAVADALQQADAVIYVLSVAMPMSKSEMLYLKTSVIPQKYTSLFLAANFSDMMRSEAELSRIRESIKEKLEVMLPDQKIWMVSALDEQCRQREEERPQPSLENFLEGEFNSFRESMLRLIHEKKDHILPDRMNRMIRIMCTDLEDNLSALEQGVCMSGQQIQEAAENILREKENQAQRLEQYCQNLDQLLCEMEQETTGWMGDLILRLEGQADSLSCYSVDELSKYYPFFCIDTMQEAITRCVNYHIDKLFDFLDQISSEVSSNLMKGYKQSQYSFRFAITGKTWTKGDSVGFAANALFGGLISVAADGIGGIMRKKEIRDRKPVLIDNIKKQYQILLPSVNRAVAETYAELGKRAKKLLSEYYAEKLGSLQSQVEQSAMVSRADDAKKKEIQAAAEEIRTMMDGIMSTT